jgi:hypothetical protein
MQQHETCVAAVLAEMAVHQTRSHFLAQAPIVDNPAVGRALTAVYWRPGNSESFLDLVNTLTSKPLTGAAWIDSLCEELPAKIAAERREYEAGLAAAARLAEEVELNMRVVIKDGDELIADSGGAGFLAACAAFETYVTARFQKSA